MGLTYAHSFLRAHVVTEQDLLILEKSTEKAAELSLQQVGRIFGSPEECLTQADLIILAVKPQDAPALFESIRSHVHPQQVFLSIMAGVRMASIQQALGAKKIIRAMPNLPAQIGMGMTTFTASDEVTRIELVLVQNLLNTTGKTIYVERETAIDASTAISGSGPAYVYYFMESMIRAAQQMGFSQPEAELLVSQTFRGAVELYLKDDLSCSEWIARVSSRGGTTEAAMHTFRGATVDDGIVAGAMAALRRAEELGK